MNSRSLYKLLLLAVAAIPLNHIKADPIPESALVVNEIMPANIDVCMDPSMNYGSWIELYNTSAQDIDTSKAVTSAMTRLTRSNVRWATAQEL